MIYVFVATDGEVREVEYPIGRAPKYGKPVRLGGKVFRRSPQLEHRGSRAWVHVQPDVRCTTPQFTPWTPGADSYDERGNARFHSRRSAEEFAARNGAVYDPEGWDPTPSKRTMDELHHERRNAGRLTQADLERIAHA